MTCQALADAFGYLKPALQGGKRAARAELSLSHVQYGPRDWDQINQAKLVNRLKAWEREAEAARELASLDGLSASVELPPRPHRRSSFSGQTGSHSKDLAVLRGLPVKPRPEGCSLEQMDSQQKEALTSRLRTYRRIKNIRKAVRKALRTADSRS